MHSVYNSVRIEVQLLFKSIQIPRVPTTPVSSNHRRKHVVGAQSVAQIPGDGGERRHGRNHPQHQDCRTLTHAEATAARRTLRVVATDNVDVQPAVAGGLNSSVGPDEVGDELEVRFRGVGNVRRSGDWRTDKSVSLVPILTAWRWATHSR